MPLPWKKHKVTPLSQIVADLQPPKHGSSFVLEPGFPTSLVDLFVKNRTRFRKYKTKKPVHFDISHPILVTQPPMLSPAPPAPPPPETSCFRDFPVVSTEAPSLMPLVVKNDVVDEDDGFAGSSQEVKWVDECESGSGSKTVFGVVLFVFVVVVVLMTSVKEITIGISVLAVLLVFIENAGKRVVSFLMPCSDANLGIVTCLTKKVSNYVWFQKLMLKIDENCEGSESLNVGGECSSSSLSFEEIEVVENKNVVVGVCREETCFRELEIREKKMEEEDSNVKVVVVDSCEIFSQWNKTKDSRSVKLKSKMVKKLVPKKLRGSKKDKKEKKVKERNDEIISECYSIGKEDKSMNFEIEGVGKVEVIEQECVREEEVDDHGINCSQDSLMERVEEGDVIGEEKRMERVGNSGCIVLFAIVLVGLVVGRFPAMILTVTYCFMLRMARSIVT
ncbi:hypothetical protein TanjilG_19587 [Lupinus angustifolius]|uniref:Transmembrane protein n=1 Tax=Lupinus angustifolius TaxID=3871 RepID=A0A1J7GK49_LUPAN|nr:PREDICTED: uncharacterized protein LOC109361606 isoform X1 [Lupinus angustifolius]OIW00782.1 hypothetical protein TanjilG_19587 [Lupinus angustifolius]